MYSHSYVHIWKSTANLGLSHLINYERFHFKKENGPLIVENKERKAGLLQVIQLLCSEFRNHMNIL